MARALFAERGAEVQLPDVARAAGVGVGTVYRHFPTRQDLVEAAAEHRFAEIITYAHTLTALDDGLARYLRHVGGLFATDRGLSEAIETARHTPGSPPRGDTLERLKAVVARLVANGKAAGLVRKDCTVDDVYVIVGALSGIIRTEAGDWQRFLDIVLAGLAP